MLTAIESKLYSDLGGQGVTHFTFTLNVICMHLAPWEGPQVVTTAAFNEAKLTSVRTDPDDVDDLALPWDVISFECHELGSGRWQFVLYCSSIEWCFESLWPIVDRAAA
jgi:hypothetical protein